MEITAWKCEQTGRIFEVQTEYDAHIASLTAEKVKVAGMPALLAKLQELQRAPFENALSMEDLAKRIVEAYPEVVRILVELGKLKPIALERRLVAIEDLSGLAFGNIPGSYATETGLPPDTKVVGGDVSFVYEGHNFNGIFFEAVRAFPQLVCGAEDVLAMSYSPDGQVALENGRYSMLADICVMVDAVPSLKRAYDEFRTFSPQELDSLHREEAAVLRRLWAADVEFKEAKAAIVALEGDIAERTLQLNSLQQKQVAVQTRLQGKALDEVPRLKYYYVLRTKLFRD